MILVLELQISKGSSLVEKKRIRRRNYTSVPLIITLIGSASHSRVTCQTQFHNLLNRVNVTTIHMTKSPIITVEQSHAASRAEFYNSQITLVSWLINKILFERNYSGFYTNLYGLHFMDSFNTEFVNTGRFFNKMAKMVLIKYSRLNQFLIRRKIGPFWSHLMDWLQIYPIQYSGLLKYAPNKRNHRCFKWTHYQQISHFEL